MAGESFDFGVVLDKMPSEHVLVDGQRYQDGLMDELNDQLEVMSMANGELRYVGTLDQLIPKEFFRGTISLRKRLESGEITQEQHEASLGIIEKCYVPLYPGAALRCVDGRGEEDFDINDPEALKIGPQIQGQTTDIAIARRLRQGVSEGDTLKQDVQEEAETSHPFAPSGHTAVGHDKPGDYGCGAIKGEEEKTEYYTEAPILEATEGVVGAIFQADGKKLPKDSFDELPKNAKDLLNFHKTYFEGKPEILDFLTTFNAKAKQVLAGKHNEGRLILNFVRGDSLHPGKVNHMTDGLINAFGLDVGYIFDEYPEDAPILLAAAVATVMNLTDGSLEVYFRLPKQNENPAGADTENLVAA